MKSTELIGGKIILVPFTLDTVLMYHKLKRDGVDVIGFFDRNQQLWNKTYNETPILNIFYSVKVTVIICSKRYEEEITESLYSHGYLKESVLPNDKISVSCDDVDIADEVDLEQYRNLAIYEAHYLIDKIYSGYLFGGGRVWGGQARIKMLKRLKSMSLEERETAAIISHVGLMLTERCTLKCKKCSTGIQYIEHPKDSSIELINKSLDKYLEHLDFIQCLMIVGGEPLMHTGIKSFLQHIKESSLLMERIGTVLIVTNGTVLPDEETIAIMKEIHGIFYISNYKVLSRKMFELVQLLSKRNAFYRVVDLKSWNDWEQLVDYQMKGTEEDEKVAEANRNVCAHFDWPLATIKDANLYPCPFMSSSEASECLPYNDRNHLSLLSPDCTKDKIISFFESVYPGCAWCTQEHYEQPGKEYYIPVAEQANGLLEYRKYHREG